MKSTSGKFSALIIFDETIAAIQQRCDNKPVVPLVYNGTILPRKAPFRAFCGDFAGRSQLPNSPNFRTILQGYSPSLLSETIWKAGFFSLSGAGQAQREMQVSAEAVIAYIIQPWCK